MLRLHLFGAVVLEADGTPVQGRAAQRRRVALLAVLACAPAGGISRDRIVGILWPDTDPRKARRLLSEALYVLRKELGEAVVRVRGEDLDLDPDLIWTDVVAFQAALAGGRPDAAVELHRGPFLDGFYVDDAPDFEQWADRTRERFSKDFAQAVQQLGADALARDDVDQAVLWFRRLANTDPYNAATAVALMRALAAAGDRAGALAHARIHARLLKEEFDAEPNPDVESLAEELKAAPEPSGLADRMTARSRPAAAAATPGPSAPAGPQPNQSGGSQDVDAPIPAPPASAGHSPFRWALPIVGLGLAASILWFVASGGLNRDPASEGASGQPDAPAILGRSFDPPVLVAVFPFTPSPVSPEARALADEATQLLHMDLEIENLRGVEPERVRRAAILGPGSPEPGEPGAAESLLTDEMQGIARTQGWDLVIDGTMVLSGEVVILQAGLFNHEESSPLAEGTVEGSPGEMRELVARLATELLEGLAVRSGLSTAPTARMSTTSLAAMRSYLEGEQAFLDGRFADAVGSFEAAVEADEAFSWARYRLSASYLYSLRFSNAHIQAGLARNHPERLPPYRQRIIEAWDHFLNGEVGEAERLYEGILGVDPREPESLFGLAEVRSHYNPLRGRSPDEPRVEFEAVLDLYPRHGEAVHHLLESAARDGRWDDFADLRSRLPEDGDQAAVWDAVLAYGQPAPGSADARQARADALAALSRADPMRVGIAAARVAAHLHDFAGAEEVAQVLAISRLSDWSAAGWLLVAEVRAARGDFPGAREALTRVAPIQPIWAAEMDGLFALLYSRYAPDVWPPASVRAEVEQMGTEAPQSDALLFYVHAGVHDEIQVYLENALALMSGQPDALDPGSMASEARGDGDLSVRLAAGMAASLRGMERLSLGDSAGALGALQAAVGPDTRYGPVERVGLSPFFGRTVDRWQTAVLLASQPGEEEAALGWLAGLTDSFDILLAAPAHLERGRILERLGRLEEARDEYGAFLSEWVEGAPGSEMARLQEEAREALERLAPA